MNTEGIVFGLLDTSRMIGDRSAAEKFRELTIAWSRYGYHDLIIERDTVDAILLAAADGEYRYCFIQPYGCLLHERWQPTRPRARDFFSLLRAWVKTSDFFVTGSIDSQKDAWFGFKPGCLLVDLEKYRQLASPEFDTVCDALRELPRAIPVMENGDIAALLPTSETDLLRPTLPGWHWIDVSLRSGVPVLGFSEELFRHLLNLQATCLPHRKALSRYFGQGIAQYGIDHDHDALSSDQCTFMETITTQSANARKGVFLWNIESYDDIEIPRSDFQAPVSTLYSVAAGFKPNRILHTHGFADDSKVVYFDYSPNALEIRKCIVAQWDGADFPHFAKYLFKRFPHPDTFYQLWDNLTPSEVDWDDIEAIWQRELNRWEGPQALQEHWRAYQQLEHDYVCCDLLSDCSALLSKITNETSAIIWWSNAFFTMYGNWLYLIEQRKKIYDQWIEQLARINPNLYLVGSDYNNTNVNSIRAREYCDAYERCGRDYLNPSKLHQTEIRM